MRTREEFRALRELVGMTQAALAGILDVEVRSVKRWERHNDEGYYNPPQDAWDVLDAARAEQAERVDAMVARIASGEEQPVLRYWLTDREYARLGRGGDWRMENADARLAADALERMGIEVGFDGL